MDPQHLMKIAKGIFIDSPGNEYQQQCPFYQKTESGVENTKQIFFSLWRYCWTAKMINTFRLYTFQCQLKNRRQLAHTRNKGAKLGNTTHEYSSQKWSSSPPKPRLGCEFFPSSKKFSPLDGGLENSNRRSDWSSFNLFAMLIPLYTIYRAIINDKIVKRIFSSKIGKDPPMA